MKDIFKKLFVNIEFIIKSGRGKTIILGSGADKIIYKILDIETKNIITNFINFHTKFELPLETTKLVLSTSKQTKQHLNFNAVKLVNKVCGHDCNDYLHGPYIIVESSPFPPFSIEKQMDGDLFSFVAGKNNYFINFSQRIEYIYNILLALNCLHSKGYCHLDIKLENFLCESIGDMNLHIKLADFDLLRKFDDLGIVRGTPTYIDPIVLQNFKYHDIPEYNDLYAVGVIWYAFIKKEQPRSVYDYRLDHKICKVDFYKDLEEQALNSIEVDFIKKLTSSNLNERKITSDLLELIEPYVQTIKRKNLYR